MELTEFPCFVTSGVTILHEISGCDAINLFHDLLSHYKNLELAVCRLFMLEFTLCERLPLFMITFFSQVNQNDTWESFLRPLRLPHPCVNGSTLLRRIYGTHLEKYVYDTNTIIIKYLFRKYLTI